MRPKTDEGQLQSLADTLTAVGRGQGREHALRTTEERFRSALVKVERELGEAIAGSGLDETAKQETALVVGIAFAKLLALVDGVRRELEQIQSTMPATELAGQHAMHEFQSRMSRLRRLVHAVVDIE